MSLPGKLFDRNVNSLGIKHCLMTIFIGDVIGCKGDLDYAYYSGQK